MTAAMFVLSILETMGYLRSVHHLERYPGPLGGRDLCMWGLQSGHVACCLTWRSESAAGSLAWERTSLSLAAGCAAGRANQRR